MELLLGSVVLAVAVFALPNLLSGRKTKLFRRIWSSEKTGGAYGSQKQSEAVDELLTLYKVDFREGDEALKAKIGDLLADATRFDLKHPRNMGIQVMPVLARRLAAHSGLRERRDVVADLSAMVSLDGVAAFRALKSSLAAD